MSVHASYFRRLTAKTLVIALSTQSLMLSNASAQSTIGVKRLHSCQVERKSTREMIDAICGEKIDPRDGLVHKFRTFNYGGLVYEQYLLGKDRNGHAIIHEIKAQPAARLVAATPPQADDVSAYSRTVYAPQKKDHTVRNTVLVVGAVAAVGVTAAILLHKAGKNAGIESEKQRAAEKEEAFQRGIQAERNARPAVMKDAPSKITLGNDVPHGAGQTVAVAGGVPSSMVPANVPRFTTASGQPYIVQQNPNTGFLETLLIMDLMQHPYYYPGYYNYNSFGYSPFMYGPGETVVINETIVQNPQTMVWENNSFDQPYVGSVIETGPVVSDSIVTDQNDAFESPGQFDTGSVVSDTVSSGGSDFGGWNDSSSGSDFGSSSSDFGSSSGSDFGSSSGGDSW